MKLTFIILFFILTGNLYAQLKVSIGDTVEYTKEVKLEFWGDLLEGEVIKNKEKGNQFIIKKVSPSSKLFYLEGLENAVDQDGIKDQYTPNFGPIYDAKSITYYGLDFSNFGLCNPEKVGQEAEIKKFFPAWMADVNEVFTKSEMEIILKKDVAKDLQSIQSKYNSIRDNWIGFEPHRIETDKIKEIVKGYTLSQSEGIGLVLIIEHFNKEKEQALVNFTFFDIKTREVLWSIETKGDAVGAGMTNHWSKAIEDSFIPFKNGYHQAVKMEKKSRKDP